MGKSLLIVAHSQSGGTLQLARAALLGAQQSAPQIPTQLIPAAQISPEIVAASDGLIIATPENFGYMSGLIKDFFDRCFYPCETAMVGKPYALMVSAGNDGTGAMITLAADAPVEITDKIGVDKQKAVYADWAAKSGAYPKM